MASLPGQQLEEAPRYNHPCEDLLHSGRRKEYINICVPLYRASSKGDLEAAKVILEGREYLVRYSITEKKETPLHVVAAVHNSEFVRYLVDMMSEDDLKLQNEEGNNAFCLAVIAGNRKMAMIMLQKNRQLLTIRGSGNMMPLCFAAHHRNQDTMLYLYEHSQRMSSDGWTDDDRNGLFLKCIEIEYFDGALRMLNDREDLPQDKYIWNVLHVLAQKADVFHLKPLFERFCNYLERSYIEHLVTGKVSEATRHSLLTGKKSEAATHLLRKIWKKVVVKNKDDIDMILRGPVADKNTYPSQILFVAAKNGNTNFLVELIVEYPDLIWKTDDDGQTIFHVGFSRHHAGIFNLLRSIGAPRDTITQLKDKDGNTLLHSVSNYTGRRPYEHVRGASSHLLTERWVWFKRVRAMVPYSYGQVKNAAGQTPYEVFYDNHKDLIFKAEKWVKETSNQCMVVAALITTISFTTAFTFPGGYNQGIGFPMFLQNTPFTTFIIYSSCCCWPAALLDARNIVVVAGLLPCWMPEINL